MQIVIVGGGWAGCAAALSARRQGAYPILIERTDMLLGTGLVGGIMRNNGRYTATEELIAMGGGDLFKQIDGNLLHRDIEFPGHHHASLYNVGTMEAVIHRYLIDNGVDIRLQTRVTDVAMDGRRIAAVLTKQGKDPIRIDGDVFIDATGSAGPPANCNRYGNGCAMCVLRCHSFGGRVSVAEKAGVTEMIGEKNGRKGAMSGACKLHKESLSAEIRQQLNSTGVAVIPIPADQRLEGKLAIKACQQYALGAFEENIILLDTGHAKLMSPYFPLAALRRIPGFENARYEDPYAGGLGNSVRYMGMSPRDSALKVNDVENLYCAGEKAGLLVGHTEAICTGTLAGFNAVRHARDQAALVIPDSLAIGDAIGFVRRQMIEEGRLDLKYTFSGSVFFERMQARNMYTTDIDAITRRVDTAGMTGIFAG